MVPRLLMIKGAKNEQEGDDILSKLKKGTDTKEDVMRLKEIANLGDTKATLNY